MPNQVEGRRDRARKPLVQQLRYMHAITREVDAARLGFDRPSDRQRAKLFDRTVCKKPQMQEPPERFARTTCKEPHASTCRHGSNNKNKQTPNQLMQTQPITALI